MAIKEHDAVVLARPIPDHGLQAGDIGAVIFVQREGEAYEVEFVAGDGSTLGLVTLAPEDVRPLDAAEIPHARHLCSHKYGNMLSRMKTTIDLPDDLFIAAKKRAAELRQPLRALIERGLRAELGRGGARPQAKPRTIRWVTVAGGLPPGVDVSDRAAFHEWLRQQR